MPPAARHPFARLAPLLLLGLLPAAPARAAMIEPLDVDALVASAEHVAIARVDGQAARWTADGAAIVTEVRLRVERPIHDGAGAARLAAGDALTVLREGGEVGGVGMRVFGAAHFVVGERVLVFLERRGAALWTVGMAQGKATIVTDGSGRASLRRDLSGLTFLRPLAAPLPTASLDEAVAAIEAAARRLRSVRP